MAERQYDVSWPGWNVVGILGYGSYGRVYEIERDVFGHTEKAALKVISIPQNSGEIDELYNDGYDSESITQRFKSHLKEIVREYSLMSEMKGHTNIVYCDDLRYVQHDDGMGWDIYIKMELLTPLPKILGNGFSEKLVIKLGLDICNALILCKSKNIVHRDIKPQNIFVSEDRNFKLGDFGIAKTAERTTSGTKTGTYKYMAPEVYNNQPYGHAADIYSLGMVLYWLLNERRTPFLPLPPQVPTATDEEHARDSRFAGFPIPEPLHGSDALKRIVLKACAFWPEDRYKNAAEMLKDLLSLARNGTYTSLNQHITYPSGNEPRARTPVTDMDKTVGNFGHVQKEETPSEETVGIFVGRSGNESSTKDKVKFPPILLGVALCATIIIVSTMIFFILRGADVDKVSSQNAASLDTTQSMIQTMAIETAPEMTISEVESEQPTITETVIEETEAEFAILPDPKKVVDVSVGNFHVVALYEDGTVDVVSVEETVLRQHPSWPVWDASGVSAWNDIVDISADSQHIVGLKSDGTVVAIGRNRYGECDISEWTDIVSIATDSYCTVGLKSDSAVVYAGNPTRIGDISNLTNITAIAMGDGLEYLQSDGSWKKHNPNGEDELYGVYPDLVSIYSDFWNSIGIEKDGSIIIARSTNLKPSLVSDWKDITAVSASFKHIIGLKADGTVYAAGDNQSCQCNVSHWTDIDKVAAEGSFSIGIKSDGTIQFAGDREQFDIGALNKADIVNTGSPGVVAHTDSGVNVRSGPGTEYYQVTKLPYGTPVIIIETSTDDKGIAWGRTMYGWVSMDYIELN